MQNKPTAVLVESGKDPSEGAGTTRSLFGEEWTSPEPLRDRIDLSTSLGRTFVLAI
jgi:hypothetical protein